MNHEQIDDGNVVERYVLGRLSAEEQERFEDHYADCPRCLEAVEVAQELRAGLRARADSHGTEVAEMTAEPVAEMTAEPAVAAVADVAEFPSGERLEPAAPARTEWLRWAAVAVLALLPSWWLAERNADLRHQVERLESPFFTAPHAVLELRRDTGSVGQRVTPSPDEVWIHLAVDLGDFGGGGLEPVEGITAELFDEAGDALWRRDDLSPPPMGPLTLLFPRRWLAAGHYRLEVGLRAGDRVEPAGSFDFEVLRAP